MSREHDLLRIEDALQAALAVFARYRPGEVRVERKSGGDPVTETDRAVDECLRTRLPCEGEGWLSEETRDDPSRLSRHRVWVVDPLDGTKEFAAGIPEFSVSIGLVENGAPVAGGIANPATGQIFLGGEGRGVRLNGRPVRTTRCEELAGAAILASRSEVSRGEWDRFDGAPIRLRQMGSVAYKLACVAAGLADATWTLVPKHEWDVAAGVALVEAAGGAVFTADGSTARFNRSTPRFENLIATAPGLVQPIRALLGMSR